MCIYDVTSSLPINFGCHAPHTRISSRACMHVESKFGNPVIDNVQFRVFDIDMHHHRISSTVNLTLNYQSILAPHLPYSDLIKCNFTKVS